MRIVVGDITDIHQRGTDRLCPIGIRIFPSIDLIGDTVDKTKINALAILRTGIRHYVSDAGHQPRPSQLDVHQRTLLARDRQLLHLRVRLGDIHLDLVQVEVATRRGTTVIVDLHLVTLKF